VLIPEENAKDLVEIADSIKSGLEIIPVSRMDEVLARAMTRKPKPIEWDETTITAAAVPKEAPVEDERSPRIEGGDQGDCWLRAGQGHEVMATRRFGARGPGKAVTSGEKYPHISLNSLPKDSFVKGQPLAPAIKVKSRQEREGPRSGALRQRATNPD